MPHRVPRRGLLAAGAGLVVPPAAAQPGPQGFRARATGLRLGANLERWFPVAANNHARRLGRGWWQALRGAGFDHARLFLPDDAGDGEDVPRLFATAIQDATETGLPVLLGLADLFHESNPWDAGRWRSVAARARFFAQATDPAMVALAPLNEPAFPGPEAWTPLRDRLLAMLRAEAPRHTLAWGGHEWCSWRSLLPQPPPGDANTIAEVHDYEGGDARWIADRFGQVAAWGRRHGRTVMVTELGGALPNGRDTDAWAEDLTRLLPALHRMGLPAALWAITHGNAWRLQEREAPELRGRLAAVVRANSAR